MQLARPWIICRPDRVGDVIIATSCLAVLRQYFPAQPLVFLAREVMRPLLSDHPILAGFISADGRPATLVGELREWNASAIIHLHPDRLCEKSSVDAEIPQRIGYSQGWLRDRELTKSIADTRAEGLRHESSYNLDLFAALAVAVAQDAALRPNVHLSQSSLRSLQSKLRARGAYDVMPSPGANRVPYVVLNPGAFSGDLRWPAENFTWLARELLARGWCQRIVLTGERNDDPSIAQVRRDIGGSERRVLDLSGETDLGELGWLLHGAQLLVSRNTGTTHLAAAVQCPCVELFGRTEPRYGPVRWRALSDSVEVVTPPAFLMKGRFESRRAFWRRGHQAIAREDVLAAVSRVLHDARVRVRPSFP